MHYPYSEYGIEAYTDYWGLNYVPKGIERQPAATPAYIPSLRGNDTRAEYTGSIVVNGDIDNIHLIVHGHLHCKGAIHSSTIIVLGTAKIEGECLYSSMYVQQSLSARIVRHSDILCDASVEIIAECRTSVIRASGAINARTATMFSGRYEAGTTIGVRRALYDAEHTPLLLRAATEELQARREAQFYRTIQNAEQALTTQHEVLQTQQRAIEARHSGIANHPILLRLQREEHELEVHLASLRMEQVILQKQRQTELWVKAMAKVESGVEVGIGKETIALEQEFGPTGFFLSVRKGIVARNLSE